MLITVYKVTMSITYSSLKHIILFQIIKNLVNNSCTITRAK